MIDPRYIDDPETCARTVEEFLAEFKENIYPAYASYGFTLPEAVNIWKLNTIYNQLINIESGSEDSEQEWKGDKE